MENTEEYVLQYVFMCIICRTQVTAIQSHTTSWVPGQTAAHTDPGNLCRMADFQGEKTWRQ